MASFEEQLTALETVVEKLERGELSLDDSVRLFEEGIKLSNACKAELDAAEGRIQVLVAPESSAVRVEDLEIEDADADADADADEDDDDE
jgi:exodeoxyribonuclease VII small subunit